MARVRRAAGVALGLALACLPQPAAVAGGPSYQVGDPPAPCDAALFSDRIGTDGADVLQAQTRPQRLWGLAGPDRLTGSATRASCLFGGRGPDVLDVAAGGGLAFGEAADDWLRGGPLSDVLDGGPGVDGFAAGAGADTLRTRDGTPELVDCGEGGDRVVADRADVLMGCELTDRKGPGTPLLTAHPRSAGRQTLVRVGYTLPEGGRAGAYRIVLTTGAREAGCAAGPVELTRLPVPGKRVRAGRHVRVGLRPPAGGWCPGVERAVVVLYRSCRAPRCLEAPAGEPVARVRWTVAGPG